MEYVGQRNIKKLCNFYVSDLHLSVMLLPYFNKQINEDVEITTIFEKIEKQHIEEVLGKLNIKNKEKILDINWLDSNKNTNEEINKVIENEMNTEKDNIFIIGGNKKYISENNDNIIKLITEKGYNSNVKIINCYNVEEVGMEMKNIVKKYDGILNTSGEINVMTMIK